MPTVSKVCEGFCRKETLFTPEAVSSKFHCQLVMVPMSEMLISVKFTFRGAHPSSGDGIKSARSSSIQMESPEAFNVMEFAQPNKSVTINITSKVS